MLKNVREPLIRESNREAPIVTEKSQDGATSHRSQESAVFGHHAAILDDTDAGPGQRLGGAVVTDTELKPHDVGTPGQR